MTEPTSKSQDEEAGEKFVNYMPSMPRLSSEPGRVERFLKRLFRRRGPLRPVYRELDE